MGVIVTPLVAQHCLALDQFAIEWSGLDDSEKESTKKLFDDFSKDWIAHTLSSVRMTSTDEINGVNSGYFVDSQQLMFAVILDPPEANNS